MAHNNITPEIIANICRTFDPEFCQTLSGRFVSDCLMVEDVMHERNLEIWPDNINGGFLDIPLIITDQIYKYIMGEDIINGEHYHFSDDIISMIKEGLKLILLDYEEFSFVKGSCSSD
jgi:hypothetical protein